MKTQNNLKNKFESQMTEAGGAGMASGKMGPRPGNIQPQMGQRFDKEMATDKDEDLDQNLEQKEHRSGSGALKNGQQSQSAGSSVGDSKQDKVQDKGNQSSQLSSQVKNDKEQQRN